jgi:hypothetical protein
LQNITRGKVNIFDDFGWETLISIIGRKIDYENKFITVSPCSHRQVLDNMVPKIRERLFPFTAATLYSIW